MGRPRPPPRPGDDGRSPRFRSEFPILEKTTYLISNSLGAMPRGAEDALSEYVRTWATRGVRAWAEGWWDLSVAVGDEIAPLFGAAPGTVTDVIDEIRATRAWERWTSRPTVVT